MAPAVITDHCIMDPAARSETVTAIGVSCLVGAAAFMVAIAVLPWWSGGEWVAEAALGEP